MKTKGRSKTGRAGSTDKIRKGSLTWSIEHLTPQYKEDSHPPKIPFEIIAQLKCKKNVKIGQGMLGRSKDM